MSLNLKKAICSNKIVKQISKSNKHLEQQINKSNKQIEKKFKNTFGIKNKSKKPPDFNPDNSINGNSELSEQTDLSNLSDYDSDELEISNDNLEKNSIDDDELIIIDTTENSYKKLELTQKSEPITQLELLNIHSIESNESNESIDKELVNELNQNILVREHIHKLNESPTKLVIIREISGLDIQYKTFIINKTNNVYSCPLLPIVEETEFTNNISEHSASKLKSLMSKGYWDRKIGKVYRIKFICQVCGKVPCGFKGYRVHVVHGWAKNILNTLAKSLQVIQFALMVSGIPNGVSEIGKLALKSIDTLQGDIINSKLKDISNESIDHIKKSIYESMEKDYGENNSESEIKYVPITSDYINGVIELFTAFGDNIPPRKSGLICVTRSEDFECGWVCQGSNGISSECYKKFLHSDKLTSLIRYSFQ